jgi:hypothetical protein
MRKKILIVRLLSVLVPLLSPLFMACAAVKTSPRHLLKMAMRPPRAILLSQ